MHSSRRRLHRRDRQSKDLVGSKSELVVVVVAALVVKVPVVVVEVVVVVVAGPTGPRWRSKLIADTLWNEASQPFLAKYTSTFHKASASETCRRSPRSLHGDERRRHVHVQRLFEIHRGDRVAAAEKKTCTLELKDAGTISFKMVILLAAVLCICRCI